MPKKTIFFVLGERSAYNSSFSLASLLVQKGYEVVYLVFGMDALHIKNNGFKYALLDPKQKRKRDLSSRKAYARYYYTYQYVVNRKIEMLILKERPCLCLINALNRPLSVKFLKHRIPLVNYINEFIYRFSARVPSVFSAVRPAGERHGNLAGLLSWIYTYSLFAKRKFWFSIWAKYLFSQRRYVRLDYNREIRAYGGKSIMCEYGPRLKGYDYFAYPAELDLPGKRFLSPFVYGGAHIYKDRNDVAGFELRIPADKKIVYCSMGTWSLVHLKKEQRWKFYDCLLSAIGQRPDLHLVLSIPKDDYPPRQQPQPCNVQIHPFVPQLKALSVADVFITHGGSSSIKEAVSSGVPMILFPGAVDQPGNAARAVYHKLGVKGDFQHVSEQHLLHLIDTVMKDEPIRRSVQQFKVICREQYDCAKGAAFLEAVIRGI